MNAALSVCLFSCKYCDICISGFRSVIYGERGIVNEIRNDYSL